jgi:metallo-beta-lactamase family protein
MVTGSCYLLEAGGLRLLVDCGMFQGKEEELNDKPFGMNPATLNGVILTHAHIDHSGRLPLLRKQGFRGPIYTHPATADLTAVMLLDSAHIQESDAERENRKGKRAGHPPVAPLYTIADATAVAEQLRNVPYDELVALSDTVQIRLQDAGHILGSAFVEVFETDGEDRQTKLVFSGDLGQPDRPILRDPTVVDDADYLILESTYGDRLHQPRSATREALAEIIRSTVSEGGNVIIPSFAIGRTQEVLYELNALTEAKQLPPGLRIVLDSPLAAKATEVTARHVEVFDEAAAALMQKGDNPFAFAGLSITRTPDESKALNESREPMVIIAAGGMAEAGRVVHHLKHNLWRPNCTVLFVGFQAEGTLGRRILDGAPRVHIHGEEVAVRARIESLPGLSAHADQAQILAWTAGLKHPPLRTFLTHGEGDARNQLARLLTEQEHRVELPAMGQKVTLPTAEAWGRKKVTAPPVRVAVAPVAALSMSAQRMSALIRELQAMRKAWYQNGPHLPAGQAAELAHRAETTLRQIEEMRRLIESAGN